MIEETLVLLWNSMTQKFYNNDCYIVKVVAGQAILHGQMISPLGRSALYCVLQY